MVSEGNPPTVDSKWPLLFRRNRYCWNHYVYQAPCVLAAGDDMCVFHVQGVLAVGGEDASVVCSHFGNKILICISHYQKIGTLVSGCTSTQFEQPSDLHLYPVCIQVTYFPTPSDSLENS